MPPPKDPAKFEAYRQKQAEDQLGRKRSPEAIAKTGAASKARWQNPAYKQKMSDVYKKRWRDPDFKAKMSAAQKGSWEDPVIHDRRAGELRIRNQSPEFKEHSRQGTLKRFEDPAAHDTSSADAQRMWQSTRLQDRKPYNRSSPETQAWRKQVLERDDFTCQMCWTKEKLIVHHIVSWRKSVALRFDVTNGITLCNSCHGKHHHPKKVKVGANS